jgi:hypothetical protein
MRTHEIRSDDILWIKEGVDDSESESDSNSGVPTTFDRVAESVLASCCLEGYFA